MHIQPFSSFSDAIAGVVRLESTQCKCLDKYLHERGAQSFVVENDYVDAGFLVDYASYYARCFEDVPRLTHRVHFFALSELALDTHWNAAVADKKPAQADALLQEAYLGFVVIKPLPDTIIGRTCLRTYPAREEGVARTRHYPIKRNYDVLLEGIPLALETVAFQEQDNEIAACSTTAIWYALHGLPKYLTTQLIPSPYEITRLGSQLLKAPATGVGEVTRRFPTNGLTVEQIAAALDSQGLDSIVCGLKPDQLAEYTAAFVGGGCPMIVVGRLYTSAHRDHGYGQGILHAITVLGYASSDRRLAGPSSDRIERIYAHDDNVGPYTSYAVQVLDRCKFPELLVNPGNSGQGDSLERAVKAHLFNASGRALTGQHYRRMVPVYVIVPVNPKIRFPYETVFLLATQIAKLISTHAPGRWSPGTVIPQVAWGIRLRDLSTYMAEIRAADWLDPEAWRTCATSSWPRFLWVLRFTTVDADQPLLELVLDATALRQAPMLLAAHTPEPLSIDEETLISVLIAWIDGYLAELQSARLDSLESGLLPIFRALHTAWVDF